MAEEHGNPSHPKAVRPNAPTARVRRGTSIRQPGTVGVGVSLSEVGMAWGWVLLSAGHGMGSLSEFYTAQGWVLLSSPFSRRVPVSCLNSNSKITALPTPMASLNPHAQHTATALPVAYPDTCDMSGPWCPQEGKHALQEGQVAQKRFNKPEPKDKDAPKIKSGMRNPSRC